VTNYLLIGRYFDGKIIKDESEFKTMQIVNFEKIKRIVTGKKKATLIKIAAGVLSVISLLSISVFTQIGNAADKTIQEPGLPEANVAGEFPPQKVCTPDSVASGEAMVYIKPDKVVSVGEELSFTISAEDVDGDTLFYSAADLPDGADFDTESRTFSWTPRYDQAGIYSVRFEVTDGEFTDSEDITISVVQFSENWDVNGDTHANVLDMVLVGQHWGETGLTGWILEDTNEDGTIDVLDQIIIGQNWTD
jgi:hypothetical protein